MRIFPRGLRSVAATADSLDTDIRTATRSVPGSPDRLRPDDAEGELRLRTVAGEDEVDAVRPRRLRCARPGETILPGSTFVAVVPVTDPIVKPRCINVARPGRSVIPVRSGRTIRFFDCELALPDESVWTMLNLRPSVADGGGDGHVRRAGADCLERLAVGVEDRRAEQVAVVDAGLPLDGQAVRTEGSRDLGRRGPGPGRPSRARTASGGATDLDLAVVTVEGVLHRVRQTAVGGVGELRDQRHTPGASEVIGMRLAGRIRNLEHELRPKPRGGGRRRGPSGRSRRRQARAPRSRPC